MIYCRRKLACLYIIRRVDGVSHMKCLYYWWCDDTVTWCLFWLAGSPVHPLQGAVRGRPEKWRDLHSLQRILVSISAWLRNIPLDFKPLLPYLYLSLATGTRRSVCPGACIRSGAVGPGRRGAGTWARRSSWPAWRRRKRSPAPSQPPTAACASTSPPPKNVTTVIRVGIRNTFLEYHIANLTCKYGLIFNIL